MSRPARSWPLPAQFLATAGAFLLGALIFAACGGATSDDATPAVAGTTEEAEDAAEGGNEEAGSVTETSAAPTEISFANDVQPVIEANCVSCHSGSGPGTTHLTMETAGSFADVAEFASFRIEDGQMPPWPLTGLHEVSYKYDLSMTDQEKATVIEWARSGAVLDVDAGTELTATAQAFPPIDADAVLYPDVPYEGSDKLDDYRCRVIDPELDEQKYVTALEIRPDETRVLHHALIFRAEADQRSVATQEVAADGQPGWNCQALPGLGGGTLEQIGSWAPGNGPVNLPEGSGLQMEAGDFFVIQWHYHYDGEAFPDNSGLAVEYASDEVIAAAGGSLDPVRNIILLGPVEIPCASFESGPLCDRDAAVARLATEFGTTAALIPEFINRECGVTPADFSQFTDGIASSSCEMDAPVGDVISIWPHLHELGTTYRLTLNPGTPDERVLIDIDKWNFEWQIAYYLDEPLEFTANDRLLLECGWDRALWPAGAESRYVVWAEGTQDEMCYNGIALR